jgi:hypothetical protein
MFFCLASFSSAASDEEKIDLKIKGQIMSAELQGVPLRLILEKLKREKGIWYKGGEPGLGEKVSIRFKDLPLEEGLRRILSRVSHVLFFDRENELVGLVILGEKGSRGLIARDEPPAMQEGLSSESLEGGTVSRHPSKISSNPFLAVTSKKKSTGAATGKNLPSPQDHHTEITEGTSKNPFEVFKNPFTIPFNEKTSPSPENPFNENVSPGPENPFFNPNLVREAPPQ